MNNLHDNDDEQIKLKVYERGKILASHGFGYPTFHKGRNKVFI